MEAQGTTTEAQFAAEAANEAAEACSLDSIIRLLFSTYTSFLLVVSYVSFVLHCIAL